jgi:hypothetical protein
MQETLIDVGLSVGLSVIAWIFLAGKFIGDSRKRVSDNQDAITKLEHRVTDLEKSSHASEVLLARIDERTDSLKTSNAEIKDGIKELGKGLASAAAVAALAASQ